jgi:AcrR family transcriptional regulator
MNRPICRIGPYGRGPSSRLSAVARQQQYLQGNMKSSTFSKQDRGEAPRRPGRPRPHLVEKDRMRFRILDTAEQLFASKGYAATSFRDIASEAQVNPALISYYFGSKRALFEAVYKRRGKQLTDRWAQLLDELDARPGSEPTLQELLWAFLVPQFEMRHSGPGGMAFIQLQARVHSECDELSFQLRREVYDTVAKRFVTGLERALPHMDRAEVNWRFMFVIGVGFYLSSGVDRLVDLSSGRYDSQRQSGEAIPRIMSFCVAGFTGPATSLGDVAKRSLMSVSKRSPPRRISAARRAKVDKPTYR